MLSCAYSILYCLIGLLIIKDRKELSCIVSLELFFSYCRGIDRDIKYLFLYQYCIIAYNSGIVTTYNMYLHVRDHYRRVHTNINMLI